MKKLVNGEYIELTAEEMAELEKQGVIANAIEAQRPFTDAEIADVFFKQKINELEVDDKTALRMKSKYPAWEEIIGKAVGVGFKFTYKDGLYKVISAHTAAEGWRPDEGTESLYARIDETHSGELSDPIPYSGNTALICGIYYVENSRIYKCIRDTEIPVYGALSDLAGIYVEAVS